MYRFTLLYIILFLVWIRPVWAGSTIAGKVVSHASGDVLPDVQITFSDHGVITDSLGHFVIELDSLSSSPVELEFRHILYEPKTLVVDGSTTRLAIQLDDRHFTTRDITVTADKPFAVKSPVAARSFGKRTIERQIATVVADILATDPAVCFKSHYQSPVVMRGLTGHRLLILRNGNRRFGSYPAGFMTHTINIYDLEKIEIQKGPASVIYGPGAIAGIINLVDKSPFKRTGYNFRVTSTYASNNTETANLVCGGWSNGSLGIKAAIRLRQAEPYHDASGSEIFNSFYKDKDGFASIGYRFGNQDIQFSAEQHSGGPWGQPLGFSGTRYLYVTTPNEITRDYQLAWHYHGNGLLDKMRISTFYANNERDQTQLYLNAGNGSPSYREETFYTDSYYGARLLPEFKLSEKLSLKSGAEFYAFRIASPMHIRDYYQDLYFENRISNNARIYNYGIYSELEASPAAGITIIGGVRYDHADIYEGSVHDLEQEGERRTSKSAPSATMSIQFPVSKLSRFKINLARAFRMPTPQEMFSNTYTANGVFYGNPELRPEHSWNADLVWQYNRQWLSVEISPFYWMLSDMISKDLIFHLPGLNYQYVNIGKARLWGGEAAVTLTGSDLFKSRDNLSLHCGVAYTNGTDVSAPKNNGIPLDHIPPLQWICDLDYNWSISNKMNANAALHVQYTALQDRLPTSAYMTPAFTLVSFGLGTEYSTPHGNMSLRLVFNNLFNARYYAFQSFVPGKGRDIRLQWSTNWGE